MQYRWPGVGEPRPSASEPDRARFMIPNSPSTDTPLAPAGTDRNRASIRSMFARITPTYDRLNHLLSGALDYRWRAIAAREMTRGLEPCRRVLDVATGTGDLARALAKRMQGGRVVGVPARGIFLISSYSLAADADKPRR